MFAFQRFNYIVCFTEINSNKIRLILTKRTFTLASYIYNVAKCCARKFCYITIIAQYFLGKTMTRLQN